MVEIFCSKCRNLFNKMKHGTFRKICLKTFIPQNTNPEAGYHTTRKLNTSYTINLDRCVVYTKRIQTVFKRNGLHRLDTLQTVFIRISSHKCIILFRIFKTNQMFVISSDCKFSIMQVHKIIKFVESEMNDK